MHTDFQKCREKIPASPNDYCNRWCEREHVECDALKDWILNIFKIIDRRISFYSQNTNMLPRKPKISYRYLKSGIEEFHRKSRKENPQKLTQLSSRSHPRHLVGKKDSTKRHHHRHHKRQPGEQQVCQRQPGEQQVCLGSSE